MTVLKNSVGIWAFGPAVTRFVPPGYHHEVAQEPIPQKTRRVRRRGEARGSRAERSSRSSQQNPRSEERQA